MKSMGEVLQIVGNETRRRILTLLSEEPHYISQIAKKLDVTQPAILKHLGLLQRAGLIESFWRKSPLGAARKYYKICDSVGIEIAIHPKDFRVARRPQRMSCPKYLKMERAIKQLNEEINRAEDVAVKAAKARELMEMADVLLSCEDYEKGNWNCENCHRITSLRKEVSQIILQVSEGDIGSGLRRLTETINQLMSGLLPSSAH
ncbi:MAG: Helix-turn-helix domain protein [Candidatus Bathyarchaeota archaeon BA2]|nr:MAG: Helix-turn-helix domain protein [Candidatus Bathyarchaeota archaeon BA2]